MNAFIALALLVFSAGASWIGGAAVEAAQGESFAATALFAAGIVAGLAGVVALPNFLRGVFVIRSIEKGRAEIARWTVSADELDRFRENDLRRSALGAEYDNDYWVPKISPPGGLTIIFSEDGLLIDGTYFPLVTAGLFRFSGVQILPENPLAIEFGMIATSMSDTSSVNVYDVRSVLRLPVSRQGRDDAVKVLNFFKSVDAREIIVNEGVYTGRTKWALGGAAMLFALAAYGYWRVEYAHEPDTIALVALVTGVVGGMSALSIAAVCRLMDVNQRN
jgi:hypothetical protein